MEAGSDVTQLLVDWKNGNRLALDQLTPLVAAELRKLAAHYLAGERSAATLQPTALVNEAYLRLVSQRTPDWECRSHFFGVAAQLMRQILVDHARKHRSAKRGLGMTLQPLDEAIHVSASGETDLVDLDDALNKLEKLSPRQSRIIELRYFAGFTVDETAALLGVSEATITRDQRMAEAFLHRQLTQKRKP